jgi:predicted RNase H-like HicB family nuclease
MMRFYPVLLFRKGPSRWLVEVLDFPGTTGYGKTSQEAQQDAQERLQERVNDVEDHQELPYPSHQLVTEHKLVVAEAHGWALIGVKTRLKSDSPDDIEDINHLMTAPKEKSNDSKRKGNKKKRRR